jgi:hypothetical protein
MGIGDLFKLAKLTITGYADSDRTEQIGQPFVAQYNPESLSLRHEAVFNGQSSPGGTAGTGQWSHSSPQRLSVNLVLDGTGVDQMGIALLEVETVRSRIEHFIDICCKVQEQTHEPPHLRLDWGPSVPELGGFLCRLESVDINYKSFDRDGEPLHAELAAAFVKVLTPRQETKLVPKASPDLTHRRVVKDGDTLPLLCQQVYGSAAHYLRVAQVNALDDFRNLVAGRELFFPPFERPRKR